jgi:hypothetical protein
MSLSDLASLGSFVSGVAVLASLVFLFFQMRQMTEQARQSERNQRALMNQGYFARVQENLHWLAAPTNNELRARINAGDTTFTAEELYLLNLVLRTTLMNVQDVYQQHQSGLLDTEVFDTSMLAFRTAMLSQPVFRALWMDTAPTIAPGFRAVVEAMLAEIPPAKPVDVVANFNANLAKVRA